MKIQKKEIIGDLGENIFKLDSNKYEVKLERHYLIITSKENNKSLTISDDGDIESSDFTLEELKEMLK